MIVPLFEDYEDGGASGYAKAASIGIAIFWILVAITVCCFKYILCEVLESDTSKNSRQEPPEPKREYVTPHGGIPSSEIGLNYIPRTPKPLKANMNGSSIGQTEARKTTEPLQYGLTPNANVESNGAVPAISVISSDVK